MHAVSIQQDKQSKDKLPTPLGRLELGIQIFSKVQIFARSTHLRLEGGINYLPIWSTESLAHRFCVTTCMTTVNNSEVMRVRGRLSVLTRRMAKASCDVRERALLPLLLLLVNSGCPFWLLDS